MYTYVHYTSWDNLVNHWCSWIMIGFTRYNSGSKYMLLDHARCSSEKGELCTFWSSDEHPEHPTRDVSEIAPLAFQVMSRALVCFLWWIMTAYWTLTTVISTCWHHLPKSSMQNQAVPAVTQVFISPDISAWLARRFAFIVYDSDVRRFLPHLGSVENLRSIIWLIMWRNQSFDHVLEEQYG